MNDSNKSSILITGANGFIGNRLLLLLSLRVSIGAVTQDTIVNVAHTTEGLSQQLFLLWVRVEAEFVGTFSFHTLDHRSCFCEVQQLDSTT